MNTKNRTQYRPLIIATVSVVVLWITSGLSIVALYDKLPDSPGTFGDMFGVINSLFSGPAFA